MTTIEFLKNQVIETRQFTKQLISEMPEDLWFERVDNTDSNFAWQIGHMYLAQNYHIISCCFGVDKTVLETISAQKHAKVFGGLGSPNRSVEKGFISVEDLKSNFDYVYNLSVEKLASANDKILTEALEPTMFKNPIANTKYEAIAWSFKHEMWHCAEMEQIKIGLGKQFQWL